MREQYTPEFQIIGALGLQGYQEFLFDYEHKRVQRLWCRMSYWGNGLVGDDWKRLIGPGQRRGTLPDNEPPNRSGFGMGCRYDLFYIS